MAEDNPPTVVVTPAQGVVGVATGAVDALRGTPMLLVMVLLNCAFIIAGAWYLRNQQDHAFGLVKTMFDRCLPALPPRFMPSPNEHQGTYPPSPLNGLATEASP
jgi:hypothetical protein